MRTTHTPAPWGFVSGFFVTAKENGDIPLNSRVVFGVKEEWHKDDVAFVLRAINSHDEMVEALKIAERVTKTYLANNRYPDGTVIPGDSEELRTIRAALAKAAK